MEKNKITDNKIVEKVKTLLEFFDVNPSEVKIDVNVLPLKGVNITLKANDVETTKKLVGKNASTIRIFRECFKKWGIWNEIMIYLYVEPFKEE
jgi:hypothetical protein